MNRLSLRKLASDFAFETAAQTQAQTDVAIANKAVELNLDDKAYALFKNDVTNFRNQYRQAIQQDAQDAKQAEQIAARTAKLAPIPQAAPVAAAAAPTNS